jgi:hypothetical protein
MAFFWKLAAARGFYGSGAGRGGAACLLKNQPSGGTSITTTDNQPRDVIEAAWHRKTALRLRYCRLVFVKVSK